MFSGSTILELHQCEEVDMVHNAQNFHLIITHMVAPCQCHTNDCIFKSHGSSSLFCTRASLSLQTQAPRLQFCPKADLPLQSQESRLQFYQGWIGTVTSHCFPHPTLSLASEKIPGTPVWRWGEWIWLTGPFGLLPKFTTGVKYQFHQGFYQIRDPEIPITLHPPPMVSIFSPLIWMLFRHLWPIFKFVNLLYGLYISQLMWDFIQLYPTKRTLKKKKSRNPFCVK